MSHEDHLRLDRSSNTVILLLLAFLRRTFAVGIEGAAGAEATEAADTTAEATEETTTGEAAEEAAGVAAEDEEAAAAVALTAEATGEVEAVEESATAADEAGASSDSAAPRFCSVDFIWSATAPVCKEQIINKDQMVTYIG